MSDTSMTSMKTTEIKWGRVRQSRRVQDKVLRVFATGSTMLAVFVLFWILGMLLWKGGQGINLDLFTKITPGPGTQGGGLLNAIVGSIVLTTLGISIATPIGVMAGTYLAEYGRGSKLADLVRFINDILLSAPSILIGLFVYVVLVMPFQGYSGWAGSIALAIIALPVIVRTTEDMLRLVPNGLREAAAALGAPSSVVIRQVCWRAAKAGIVTGILLALARIAGETAPLLFTALNNSFWFNANLTGGISNLPVTIYAFASAPYDNWQQLAWAGALLITATILVLSVSARALINRK